MPFILLDGTRATVVVGVGATPGHEGELIHPLSPSADPEIGTLYLPHFCQGPIPELGALVRDTPDKISRAVPSRAEPTRAEPCTTTPLGFDACAGKCSPASQCHRTGWHIGHTISVASTTLYDLTNRARSASATGCFLTDGTITPQKGMH